MTANEVGLIKQRTLGRGTAPVTGAGAGIGAAIAQRTVMRALGGHAPAVVDGRVYAVQAFMFGRALPTRTVARLTGEFFRAAARKSVNQSD